MVANLRVLQKQHEVQGEAAMSFINDRLEQIWDNFEEAKTEVEGLHQLISGQTDAKELEN